MKKLYRDAIYNILVCLHPIYLSQPLDTPISDMVITVLLDIQNLAKEMGSEEGEFMALLHNAQAEFMSPFSNRGC